ncbi:response regulator transcription factor [Bacteroidales bacterium]|nr:response regulator transcription factor [Bacteroidales bacterium]
MKKILIIEDDTALMQTIDDLLTIEGFEVYNAKNGVVGVQKAQEIIPDIIISDIMMPDLNGIEVLKQLRKLASTSLIPFIFLTAKSTLEDLRTGMQLGADDYITKPFNNDDLINAVKIRLERHSKILSSGKKNQANVVLPKSIEQLTKREKEIIKYFCKGLSMTSIADSLHISFHTVDSHRRNIERKLKLKNIPSLVNFAVKYGLN